MSKIDPLERKVIGATAVVLAGFVALIGYAVVHYGVKVPSCVSDVHPFTQPAVIQKGPNHVEAHFVAKMWGFEPAVLEVKPGTTVDIYVSSADVTHGFLVDRTNVNLMVVPGEVSYASARFDRLGDYPVTCHEYCGTGHQEMSAVIRVTENPKPFTAAATPKGREMPGARLVREKGCIACHSIDGRRGVGPTFKGLYGKEEHYADGAVEKIDEAHIRAAIQTPNSKVIQGFQPVMPKFTVTDAEIDQIIDYIKSLK